MAHVRPPDGDLTEKFDPSPVERLFVLLAVEHPYSEHLFPERRLIHQQVVNGLSTRVSGRRPSSGADWIAPSEGTTP